MRWTLSVPIVIAASAALLAWSNSFDFLCDDAFIAFRYAEHWAMHGRIEYNLGERVEGYTSFVWVLLLAMLRRLGIALPLAAHWLGAVSGVLLVVGAARLASLFNPRRLLVTAALLAVIAGNAPIAAWTLGGLETPLYTALIIACVVSYHAWLERGDRRHSIQLASCLAVATLTRPEAGLLAIALALGASLFAFRRRRLPACALMTVALYTACIIIHLGWRHAYYGDWLPNTFLVKTSGNAAELRARGFGYLGFCATELGWPFVTVLALLLFLPEKATPGTDQAVSATRLGIQCFVIMMLAYVAAIGGDFLDLYRFIVPLLPLVFAAALWRGLLLIEQSPAFGQRRWLLPGVAALFFAWYFPQQWRLGQRALQLSEVGRREHGIEPIGWTRTYALRWAATGRWISEHSRPGDSMAVGAAGAMPFYARLPNIDTFGLCDSYVARHGRVIGARPGHQRFAPLDYLLRRSPTFLLINDYASDWPESLRRDPIWEQRGYQWVEAEVTRADHQAPHSFFHYFLVRSERAQDIISTSDIPPVEIPGMPPSEIVIRDRR